MGVQEFDHETSIRPRAGGRNRPGAEIRMIGQFILARGFARGSSAGKSRRARSLLARLPHNL
jgi:hypothetical protein